MKHIILSLILLFGCMKKQDIFTYEIDLSKEDFYYQISKIKNKEEILRGLEGEFHIAKPDLPKVVSHHIFKDDDIIFYLGRVIIKNHIMKIEFLQKNELEYFLNGINLYLAAEDENMIPRMFIYKKGLGKISESFDVIYPRPRQINYWIIKKDFGQKLFKDKIEKITYKEFLEHKEYGEEKFFEHTEDSDDEEFIYE